MNEGESATDNRMIFNLKHYHIQITHTIKYAQLGPSLWNLKMVEITNC